MTNLPTYMTWKASTILERAEADLGPLPQAQWFDLIADQQPTWDYLTVARCVEHLSAKRLELQLLNESLVNEPIGDRYDAVNYWLEAGEIDTAVAVLDALVEEEINNA